MYKLLNSIKKNIFLIIAVIGCLTIVIFSALTASYLYKPTGDSFSSELNNNLALLCKNTSPDLSETQLDIIRNARVKNIRYGTDDEGNKAFYANIRLYAPIVGSAKYSGDPEEYFGTIVQNATDSGDGEEIEIYGLCRDNVPIVDLDTITALTDASAKAWEKETLSNNAGFQNAITDALIPEPFENRTYREGGGYQSAYSKWLNEISSRFASEGMNVNVNGTLSGQQSDIYSAMEQIITPYFCSLRNLSLSRSDTKPGIMILSFDSLDIIGTISSAKNPSFSAINKLAGVYSEDRSLKVSIEIDLSLLAKNDEKMKLPFMNLIRAMTKYGSSLGNSPVKIKIPTSSQVIDGKSNGQWPIQFKRAKGDGNIIVNVISMDDSGNEQSVLKLFLTDGGSITVCLSKSKYRLNFAVGTTYYGSVELFGMNGVYMRDNDNIYTIPSQDVTTITIPKQPGESMSFTDYLVGQGTDPSLIDKSQF